MIEPLRLSFEVGCDPGHAFTVWTEHLSAWWPPDHTVCGEAGTRVVLEPRVGGRIYERSPSGEESEWGEVTAWEPPSRLAYLWHIGAGRAVATDVEIAFVEVAESVTRVDVEHRGWDRLGADVGRQRRDANHSGWDRILPAFREHCARLEGPRQWFALASACFTELVASVPGGGWDDPALGVWTMRDLVGHTSRALSTIEAYLTQPPPADHLDGPVAYFLATRTALAVPAAVAARGRDAGAALGRQPAEMIADLHRRVAALVDRTADEALAASPVGAIRLIDYLPTRTFELTVHSLDIARVLGVSPPPGLRPAVRASLELAGRLAGNLDDAADLLLLITGRTGLRKGISVV